MDKEHIDYLSEEILKSQNEIWVNPVGGLGDMIMLSTALKRSFDKYGKQFCMVRRSQYTEMFINHPAIKLIGNPPIDSYIVCNDYWMRPEFGDITYKGLFITLKIFGVEDEKKNEETYLPPSAHDKKLDLIINNIPWKKRNVVISFSSESLRKMMHPIKWHQIVEKLHAQQCLVIQVGEIFDVHIHGTYSLLGATSPKQLVELLKKVDLIITPDNFVMHVAHLVQIPAIALFGPTESSRYGYNNHVRLQADISNCDLHDKCLGPHVWENYSTACPLGDDNHCMNSFDENKIINIAMSILK